jgi:hypothetical protein
MKLNEVASYRRGTILSNIVRTMLEAAFNRKVPGRLHPNSPAGYVNLLQSNNEQIDLSVFTNVHEFKNDDNISVICQIKQADSNKHFLDNLYDGNEDLEIPEQKSQIEQSLLDAVDSLNLLFRELKRIGIASASMRAMATRGFSRYMGDDLTPNEITGEHFINCVIDAWNEFTNDEYFPYLTMQVMMTLYFHDGKFKCKLGK